MCIHHPADSTDTSQKNSSSGWWEGNSSESQNTLRKLRPREMVLKKHTFPFEHNHQIRDGRREGTFGLASVRKWQQMERSLRLRLDLSLLHLIVPINILPINTAYIWTGNSCLSKVSLRSEAYSLPAEYNDPCQVAPKCDVAVICPCVIS